MENQYFREISLLKLHESSATVSVLCEFLMDTKNGKNLMSTFS